MGRAKNLGYVLHRSVVNGEAGGQYSEISSYTLKNSQTQLISIVARNQEQESRIKTFLLKTLVNNCGVYKLYTTKLVGYVVT